MTDPGSDPGLPRCAARALRAWLSQDHIRGLAVWTGILLGYAALLAAVFHRVWWAPPEDRLFFGWDATRLFWQDLVFAMSALADGELPLWNPYSVLGYSYASDPQTGLYSPVNWVLYVMGLVSGSRGAWMIQAKILVTMWLGSVGMHMWIHRRRRSHLVSFLVGTAFVLGSPVLVFKNSCLLWPILYLPWALLAVDAYVRRPCLRNAALGGGAIWLCGSAGAPQSFFFCCLVLFPYGFLQLVASRFQSQTTGDPPSEKGAEPATQPLLSWLRGHLLSLGLVLVLAALLLAPVYLPAWQAMPYTPRESRSLEFLLAQPQTWASLEELLLSQRDRNWFLDLYMGALAIVLAAFALVSITRKTAPWRLFWLGMAGFGILLSLGEHTRILPWLITHVPGFDLFRIPYRYKLLFVVAILALAAEGLAALVRRPLPPWQRLAWLALGGGWILYAALAASGHLAPKTPMAMGAARDHLWYLAPAVALLALPAWLRSPGWLRHPAWPRVAPWLWVPVALAVALVGLDLRKAGEEKILIMERPPNQEADRQLFARLPGLRDRQYRIFQYPSRLSAMNHQVRELGGYTTFPMRLKRFDDVMAIARHDFSILRHFNVRWVQAGVPRHLAARLPTFAHRRAGNLLEIKDPAPLVQVFPGYEVVSPGQALRRMGRPGSLRCALLEPLAALALPPDAGPPGQGCAAPPRGSDSLAPPDPVASRLVRYSRNRLLFDVRSETGGIAVINEPYFPGWTARLHGRPTALFEVNHLLRGVYVPPGAHRLELRYQPRAYPWLLAGFCLGLLILAALVVGAPLRRFSRRLRNPRSGGSGLKPSEQVVPRAELPKDNAESDAPVKAPAS